MPQLFKKLPRSLGWVEKILFGALERHQLHATLQGRLRPNAVQSCLRTLANEARLLSHGYTASKKVILSLNYSAVSVSPRIMTTEEVGDMAYVTHSPSIFNNVFLVYVLV